MLIPIALGAVALYGAYSWDKKRKATALAGALATPPAAAPGGAAATAATTSPANNPYGSISHTAPVVLPGFNDTVQHVVVAQASDDTTYPPATTQTDPANMKATVIAYQAAKPVDSGMMYYPASGDLWPIISGRLGGTTKARLTDPANNKSLPLKLLSMSDVGKLNGIVSTSDFTTWLKAGKPLKLPLGGWNDVSGPIPNAMGSIK